MRVPISTNTLEKYIADVGPLKNAFDLIGDHVVITDENANIIYANKAAEDATGFSAAEIIGKNPADLWGGHMPKEFYHNMWKTIKEDKKPFMGEIHNIKKDGKEVWQEIHIFPVLAEDGSVRYFIAVEPNITSKKRAEELNGEFTSIVGHQLKAPLTAIKLVLEWLLDEGGLTDEQKKSITGAYDNTKALTDLVSDLLVLRRIDYAHFGSESVDLCAVVAKAVDLVATQFSARKINFTNGLKDCRVAGNQLLAQQVFVSLLTNALEYSSKSQEPIQATLKDEADRYVFSCQDSGVGIPAEDQKNIFSRFFRASNANDAKKTGTGLGLFIVKIICENFGWSVRFESVKDKGSTFFVEIPKPFLPSQI